MRNIGAICRTAYSLDVDAIIASNIKQLNFEGIARTSSGALFDIPFCHSQNSLDVANELKQYGFELYGASMDGMDLKEFKNSSEKRHWFLEVKGKGFQINVKKT